MSVKTNSEKSVGLGLSDRVEPWIPNFLAVQCCIQTPPQPPQVQGVVPGQTWL